MSTERRPGAARERGCRSPRGLVAGRAPVGGHKDDGADGACPAHDGREHERGCEPVRERHRQSRPSVERADGAARRKRRYDCQAERAANLLGRIQESRREARLRKCYREVAGASGSDHSG